MAPRLRAPAVLALAGLLAACSGQAPAPRRAPSFAATIRLASPAFRPGGTLPARFTCDGEGRPPPLAWGGVPRGARSLALLVVDPDAPSGPFLHWAVYGLSPRLRGVASGPLPGGARQATSGFGRRAYGAPCPPAGDTPHRYTFTLYALRRPVRSPDGASAEAARSALERSALAEGRLIARYGR